MHCKSIEDICINFKKSTAFLGIQNGYAETFRVDLYQDLQLASFSNSNFKSITFFKISARILMSQISCADWLLSLKIIIEISLAIVHVLSKSTKMIIYKSLNANLTF